MFHPALSSATLSMTGAALEQQFWQYFRDDSLQDSYPAGSRVAAQTFTIPPWSPESEDPP